MTDKIKSAFDEVKAEHELKSSTKRFLAERYEKSAQTSNYRFFKPALAAACAAFVVVVCAAFFTYNIPVGAISLDSENSSVEFGVNCFDKVVKVTCFGEEMDINEKELRNMDYKRAVSLVLEKNDAVSPAVLTVNCKNKEKCEEFATGIKECNNGSADIECHTGKDNSSEAHAHGISTAKYNAYLILKETNPQVSLEEIKSMTMKEIRERINAENPGKESVTTDVTENGNGGNHGTQAHRESGKHHGSHNN